MNNHYHHQSYCPFHEPYKCDQIFKDGIGPFLSFHEPYKCAVFFNSGYKDLKGYQGLNCPNNLKVPTDECFEYVFSVIGPTGAKIWPFQNWPFKAILAELEAFQNLFNFSSLQEPYKCGFFSIT